MNLGTRFYPDRRCLWRWCVTLGLLSWGLSRLAADDPQAGIPIIDTHIHLYDTTRPEGVPWPNNSDSILFRPVLPKHFNAVAEEQGVKAAVIVEASDRWADNQWVLDVVRDDPDRYIGFVGHLPVGAPEFAERLRQISKDQRFVGIRLSQRPGGPAFFTDQVWQDLRQLAAMNKTLDVLMFDYSLEDIGRIAEEVPNL
ncbi:MAG: amidohydrolase family protein, partial [Planctomycetota bacterium]